ncbi:myosin light chain kinase, smooth muscle-like [Teleopsis dalmanni]|nr:myosin light chain kinase, smooth muscle-like [Teleopsis dalmanni]
MCKPEFTKPLTNTSVRDGDQLTLTCHVKGDPEPHITWSKNGKTISSSDIMDLKYKNGVASLTIHEVFPEDDGVYTCTATNSISAVETKCKLTVKPTDTNSTKRNISADKPPKIVSHLESRYVKDGETVTLACRIIGAEHFDVVWLHNNKEIKPSKDFNYTNEANIYKLQIAEIFPEDCGTYTCEAFNDAGESFSTCTINVLVPGEEPKQPSFTKYPSSVTVQESETCKFVCETQDEILQLCWLKDGKSVNETSSRYSFTKDGNLYTFSIVKSSIEDVGQYQAKAIGKKGETLCSFSVNVFVNESSS